MKKLLCVFLLLGCFMFGNISQSFSQVNTYPTLRITGISLTATDNVGVTGYLINESAVIPNVNDVNWSSTPPLEYTFDSEGIKTLYAWAKDAAGNISESKSITLIIKLPDITKPIITNFSISSQSVSLDIRIKKFEAIDDVGVTGYIIKETPSVPNLADEDWQQSTPDMYVFNSVGEKILYAYVKDGAGNISIGKKDEVNIKIKQSRNFIKTN